MSADKISALLDALYVANDTEFLSPGQKHDVLMLINEIERALQFKVKTGDISYVGLQMLIELATKEADKQASRASQDGDSSTRMRQIVSIKTDGRSKLAKLLKQLGLPKDHYWGYILKPDDLKDYHSQQIWTECVARSLRNAGISAARVETPILKVVHN